MTVTLIDFGAWYRPYGLQTDKSTGTPKKLADPLRRAHWDCIGGVWRKDGDFLICNPLGFAICSDTGGLPFDVAKIREWSRNPTPDNRVGIFVVPDDWRRYVVPVLAANACRILSDWCESRLIGGMAADARRLVARCRRLGVAYPPANAVLFRQLMAILQDDSDILCESSSAEHHSSYSVAMLDALATVLLPVGTFLVGFLPNIDMRSVFAWLAVFVGVMCKVCSIRVARTDTLD